MSKIILIVFVYNAIYVEDVEDRSLRAVMLYVFRSNTPKGCNAM